MQQNEKSSLGVGMPDPRCARSRRRQMEHACTAYIEQRAAALFRMRRDVPDLSQRMLAQTLRRLVQDGYLTRTVYATIPRASNMN